MNCQIFSTGLSSEDFDGRGTGDVADQFGQRMPPGLVGERDGGRSRCDSDGDLGGVRVHRFIAAVLQAGWIRAAPLLCLGQIAPKM
jgi:hypothetical protein